jgi:hypothetical protein
LPLDWLNAVQQGSEIEYLYTTPSQYELRYSQQDWQFALQSPFFYQDQQRTFVVVPEQSYPISWEIAVPIGADPRWLLTVTGAALVSAPAAAPAGAPRFRHR